MADYVGKPVAAVRLAIEGRETTDPALTQIVETSVGQPLSMAAVRESITHLYSLGRFEEVSVDAALDGGRVTLRYDLSPIHPVTRIRFNITPDAPGIEESVLRRAITDRYGSTPPLARAADMAHIVESALGDRGYLHASATPRSEISHEPERATLIMDVDPKARTTVGDLQIVGKPTVGQEELLKRLDVARGEPYERDRLNVKIEEYLADRRKHGYYEARITPTIRFADEDRVANVTLNVDPGPHVRLVFAGEDLSPEKRDEFVPIAREGSADEDLLEDSSHRIEEYFRAQGYRDAAAPHTRQASDGELLITFTIKKGPLYRIASYDVSGNRSLSTADLAPALHLQVEQPFADSRLDAEVGSIEAFYRRRGYATARAQPSVEVKKTAATASVVPVAVSVVILEGSRTTVESVAFSGNSAIDTATLRTKAVLRAGAPYVPGQLAADRDAIQLTYQNAGYQNATVEATPEFSADRTSARVTFHIQEGPRVFIDHVLIVGNVRTRTETIERELQVKPGDPFSLAAINESQRRLTALQLFRRARITELRHGSETTRDLLVTVEESPPTTIGYGAGVEGRRLVTTNSDGTAHERFDFAPRALFEIGRRNLFGKNRSASLFTSISRSVAYSLTEYRAVATFREPRLFNTASDAFVNGTLEQQHRSSFDFSRRSFSADIERRFSGPYRVTGTYQLQRTRVFNVKVSEADLPLIDRTFKQFLLSSVSGSVIRDTRDDALDAHEGTYVSANGQLAAKAIGSEVGFIKSFFTAQLFRTLPRTNQVVFAGDARLGMATSFGTIVDPSGIERQGQLPASERFFAGGDTTHRGFALDQLGVPGQTIDPSGFAIGGNGLVLFNAELRVPVTGAFGVVGFVDTGNVFAQVADIHLADLRTALGGGIRYKSPLGPLRFDIGFKVNRQPGENRSAWFVSFGQAF